MSKVEELILHSNLVTPIIKVEVSNSEVNYMSINVWFTGCKLACKGCQNTDLKRKKKAMQLGEVARKIKDRAEALNVEWVVFTGGNPVDSPDQLCYLLYFCKELGLKTLVYSGYTMEELKLKAKRHHAQTYYEHCDLIKTGAFKEEELVDNFHYATKNQKLYYVEPYTMTCIYEWDYRTNEPVVRKETAEGGKIPSELFFFETS